jgi:hypothetical protein
MEEKNGFGRSVAYMIQRYDILTRERIKKGFHNTIEQELDAIT